jgi:hypothetical protein
VLGSNAARVQEDSNYESKKKDVIYNVQVLYEDRVRRWSRHIWQRRRRVELQNNYLIW